MFELDLPWWEFIVRAVIVYCVLLMMVRVGGKRTVGQFTPFDLLVVMLLSECVSNGLSGGDQSVLGGLILASTMIVLNLSVGYVTARSRKISDIIEGTPELIGRDGKMFKDVMKKCRVGESDFEEALREADCKLEDMKCAFLETDGQITIMQK
ncbi:MAG: YetF domain-containing protein [Massilia sp.]